MNSFNLPLKSLYLPYFCPPPQISNILVFSRTSLYQKVPWILSSHQVPTMSLCLSSITSFTPESPHGAHMAPIERLTPQSPIHSSHQWTCVASKSAYQTLLLKLPPPVTSVMTALLLGVVLRALSGTLFSPHSSASSPPLHRSPLKTPNTIHKLVITKPIYRSWTSTEKQICTYLAKLTCWYMNWSPPTKMVFVICFSSLH